MASSYTELSGSRSVMSGSSVRPRRRNRHSMVTKRKAPRLSQWNAQIKLGHDQKVQHDRMQLQNIASDRAVNFHGNEHLYVPGDQQQQQANPQGIRPELLMNGQNGNIPMHSNSSGMTMGSPAQGAISSPMQSPNVPNLHNGGSNAVPTMSLQNVYSNGVAPPNGNIPNIHLQNMASNVMVEYQIGDKVMVDESKMGQIKSIGQHPAWGKGMTFYGVRLTEKIGDSDGEFKGQRTFSCPPGFGCFVQRNQLTQKLNTDRFDFMDEDYIEDRKKEFEAMKSAKTAGDDEIVPRAISSPAKDFGREFAAQVMRQQMEAESDTDPGESDIPRPGTNVHHIMSQSSSERILTKTKPPGKYVPTPNKPKKKKSSGQVLRRQRSNSSAGDSLMKWTGGAPRVVVVRNKIPELKEQQGYLDCKEGVRLQRQEEWKKAIEKFKLGITLLEVTLGEIDNNKTKRKWKQTIEEFRHKMSRCQFEIQNNKRNRFIKKRNQNARRQAQLQREAEEQMQKIKLSQAKATVIKREDNWKVTREDVAAKVAENEIDPNYDPTTGMRPTGDESDSSEEVNSGKVERGGDPTLAKAKREHRKKKKKKRNRNHSHDESDDSGGDAKEDGDGKDEKISKHDKELRSRIEGDVMTGSPDVSFSDVVGLNNVKLALYETIILPYIRPDLFEDVSKSTQGLLLFGPPGNGKTMIAKCVAAECDATFFSISASSITSKFVGEAERIMRTLFTMARQRAPSIIFIDEIDSLLRARGGANEAESSRRIKTEFLIQFDGVKSAESNDKTITIIGATNLPDQLDDAVLRRFPKRIMVPNPDSQSRYSLIRLLTSKKMHEIKEEGFQQLAESTNNYSCSDIAMLCRDAYMGPIRSMKGSVLLKAKKSDIPKIALIHFQASLKNIRASCSPEAIQHYFKWDEQFGSKLFLTMDVLPENMKQKPLLSVEEELRLKQEAEEAKRKAIEQQEAKRVQMEQEAEEQERIQREEEERNEERMKEKEKRRLVVNAPPEKKGSRRKSEQNIQKGKKKKSLKTLTKAKTMKHSPNFSHQGTASVDSLNLPDFDDKKSVLKKRRGSSQSRLLADKKKRSKK